MGEERTRAEEYTRRLVGAYGDALVAVVLYGSAARGDYRAWIDSIRQQTGRKCVWLLGHSEGAVEKADRDRLLGEGRFPAPTGEWPTIPWPVSSTGFSRVWGSGTRAARKLLGPATPTTSPKSGSHSGWTTAKVTTQSSTM